MRPQLILEIIRREGGGPVLLHTPLQRTQMEAEVRSKKETCAQYGFTGEIEEGADLPPDKILMLWLDAAVTEADLANDEKIRTERGNEIEEVIFEIKSPRYGDSLAILRNLRLDREALPEEQRPTPEEEQGQAMQYAYDMLEPRPVKGWEGEVPVAFQAVLAFECYSLLFPKMSEDRAFLSTASPAT
jgi:hypothetical protein